MRIIKNAFAPVIRRLSGGHCKSVFAASKRSTTKSQGGLHYLQRRLL
jgi:hypothetical protein